VIALPDGVERWVDFAIPDSSPAVRLARLDVDGESGSSLSLVEFPPGWSRPGLGHYVCGEEFVVLAGELHISGKAFGPSDCAWLPPGAPRWSSRTEAGALALAWFSGRPDWREGAGADRTGDVTQVTLCGAAVPAGGLVLRDDDRRGRTTLYEMAPSHVEQPAHAFWLSPRLWGRFEAGARLPEVPGHVLVRYLPVEG
jgi:hypothetical protein